MILAALPAFGQDDSIAPVPPEKARAGLVRHMGELRAALAEKQVARAKQEAGFALESKWDGALGDLPVFSLALIKWAENSNREGNPELAALLVESARKMSPDSVHVHYALARYNLGGGPMDPAPALAEFLEAFRSYYNDLPAALRALGRVVIFPLILSAFVGGLLAVIFIIRYGTVLAHDLEDFFPPGRVHHLLLVAITGAIIVLPLMAGLSFWWLIAWCFILFSPYQKRGERVVVYLWLIFMAASPFLVSRYCLFMSARSDPVFASAVRVWHGSPAESDQEALEKAVEANPEDVLARVSLAELLKREGYLNKAVLTYKPVLKDPDVSQMAYNNVAEIYFLAGDLNSTLKALSEADAAEPEQVEIVYNFGQYYNEAGELLKVETQFKKARDLDEKRLEQIEVKAGKGRINRALASLPVPSSILWERALRGTAVAAEVYPGVWHEAIGFPEGMNFSLACGACIVILLLLQVLSKKWKISYRCASCGRPICPRCQRIAKDPSVCMPCYSVFMGDGGAELKVKMEKRSEVQRYRDLWTRAGLVLSLLIPGSGQLMLGFVGSGIILFGLAASLVAGYLSGLLVWPSDIPVFNSGLGATGIILIFVYFILMILSALIYRSKAEGWR